MKTKTERRGSVLVMALWIIAILSVMVVSFAFEARQQAGIDVYVRERNRVKRVIDSGRVLGEVVLLGYKDAKDPEVRGGEPDWKDLFEEDRWCIPKWQLKTAGTCTIGPVVLEEEGVDYAEDESPVTIKVELAYESAEGGRGEGGIDINCMNEQDDKNYLTRFQTILLQSGIPEELEVEVEDADRGGSKRHNLMNLLIASWKDWRDDDTVVSRGPLSDSDYDPQDDDGAEAEWYRARYEEDEINEDEWRLPPGEKNEGGEIKQIDELTYIRGFRDFPSVYYGGYLYDGTKYEKEREKERGTETNPLLSGIKSRFRTSGGTKMMITDDSPEMARDLSTIPGLFPDDPEDDSAREDCTEVIQAILTALATQPEDDDEAIPVGGFYPFKDFQDLCTRVEDCGCDVEIPSGVAEYLEFPSSAASSTSASSSSSKSKSSSGDSKGGSSRAETKLFSMVITGESLGMKYVVKARCVVVEKKIQYVEWSENEATKAARTQTGY